MDTVDYLFHCKPPVGSLGRGVPDSPIVWLVLYLGSRRTCRFIKANPLGANGTFVHRG